MATSSAIQEPTNVAIPVQFGRSFYTANLTEKTAERLRQAPKKLGMSKEALMGRIFQAAAGDVNETSVLAYLDQLEAN